MRGDMAYLGSFDNVKRDILPQVQVVLSTVTYKHVKGLLKVNGVAAQRRVMLLDRKTLQYVSSCYSRNDGSFEFRNLPEQGFQDFYIVLAFDDQRLYNAEALDFVRQVETIGG